MSIRKIDDPDDGERNPQYPWKFSATVPTGTGTADPVRVRRKINTEGIIRRIEIVSTQAAQQAVGARVSLATGQRFVPRNPVDNDQPADDFIGLDQNPVTASPNVAITEGTQVDVDYINNDTEDHFVRAIVEVEEVDG